VRSDGTLQIQADADGSGAGVLRLRTNAKTRQQIDNNGDISFYEDTGTTPKFFWDASAEGLNIGATSVPFGRLDISDVGGSGSSTIFDTGANGDNYFTAGTSGIQVFRNGSTERMRIDSNGNLLVGKTSFDATATGSILSNNGELWVTRSGATPAYIRRLSTDGTLIQFNKDGTTVGSIRSVSGDSIGIGNGVAGLRFVSGTNRIQPVDMTNGLNSDGLTDLGDTNKRFQDLYLSGTANAANFNTTSDATLKTNVETLTGSLDAVKSLRGVSFDWIENGNSEVGVIAQEVEAVLPDVVSTNDQGIKSVKYGNIVALLIEAMKEQQAQIDELKAKLGE